jgi:hypothetical protein
MGRQALVATQLQWVFNDLGSLSAYHNLMFETIRTIARFSRYRLANVVHTSSDICQCYENSYYHWAATHDKH